MRGSSSHHNNPFLILCQQDATETSGACYGVMMVYSGSYQMDVERSQTGLVRVVSGIQEERFAWNLKPGETFDTPEVILSFAAEGLTPLSQQYHRFLRRNICRGPWKDKRRPVLINNWEATYFDFNTEKIVKIAEKAASLGVEMMVLDLSRPEVVDYLAGVISKLLREHHIEYIKWDMNRSMSDVYSRAFPAKYKDELDTLTVDKLKGILAFANKAASITTSRHGAIPAMPTLEEIEK